MSRVHAQIRLRMLVLALLKSFICTKCSDFYTCVLFPSLTDPVRIQLEACAVALSSFYASPFSSGVSNMIKLLQPTMTGSSEKIGYKASVLPLFAL